MILKKVDQEVDHKVVVADGIPSSRPKPIQVEAGSSLPMATRVVVGYSPRVPNPVVVGSSLPMATRVAVGYSPRVVNPVGVGNRLPVDLQGLAGNHLQTGTLVVVGNSHRIPTLAQASTKKRLTMSSNARINLVRAS